MLHSPSRSHQQTWQRRERGVHTNCIIWAIVLPHIQEMAIDEMLDFLSWAVTASTLLEDLLCNFWMFLAIIAHSFRKNISEVRGHSCWETLSCHLQLSSCQRYPLRLRSVVWEMSSNPTHFGLWDFLNVKLIRKLLQLSQKHCLYCLATCIDANKLFQWWIDSDYAAAQYYSRELWIKRQSGNPS